MNDNLIDLHTHTCYSDGELTPNELINLAYERNIKVLAITDHDTVNGLKNVDYNNVQNKNLLLIPGIELSAASKIGTIHILGYGIDINNAYLLDKLEKYKLRNRKYIDSLLNQIEKDYQISFTISDIENIFNSTSHVGRPHIAKLCVKYGYASSVRDAFDKYLIDAYEQVRHLNKKFTYQECIEMINKAGGIASLAHPKTTKLNDKELLILIKDMIRVGLQSIEPYHSTHTSGDMKKYYDIANELNLLCSGGSDYHGINTKPDIELGTGINSNLKIKHLTILDELAKR